MQLQTLNYLKSTQNVNATGNGNTLNIKQCNNKLNVCGNGNTIFVTDSHIQISMTGNGNQILLKGKCKVEFGVNGNGNQIKVQSGQQPQKNINITVRHNNGFGNIFPQFVNKNIKNQNQNKERRNTSVNSRNTNNRTNITNNSNRDNRVNNNIERESTNNNRNNNINNGNARSNSRNAQNNRNNNRNAVRNLENIRYIDPLRDRHIIQQMIREMPEISSQVNYSHPHVGEHQIYFHRQSNPSQERNRQRIQQVSRQVNPNQNPRTNAFIDIFSPFTQLRPPRMRQQNIQRANNQEMQRPSKGLTQQQFDSLPTVQYTGKPIQCSICWLQIQQGEKATYLVCFHYYHQSCISQWMRKSDKCPFCRLDIKATLKQTS